MGVFDEVEPRAARRRRILRMPARVVGALSLIGVLAVAAAFALGADVPESFLWLVLALMGAGFLLTAATREPGDAARDAAAERDAELEAQRVAREIERRTGDDRRPGSPRI